MSSAYTLRQIVDMTGLSEYTLRGWELRYKAFSPRRTQTGRRLYSENDLRKALLLRELVQRGARIGDLSDLDEATLQKMMSSEMSEDVLSNADETPQVVLKLMELVALQEWRALEKILSSKMMKLDSKQALYDLLIPLLKCMSREASLKRLSVAQEHILSSIIKQQLYILSSLPGTRVRKKAPRYVLATPEGDFHELGLLCAYASAKLQGCEALYLGCNTPKEDLCQTALKWQATHVLVAATVSRAEGAKEDFSKYIHFLDKNMNVTVPFVFAGRAVQKLSLKRDMTLLNSLEDLQSFFSSKKGGSQ